MPSQSFQNFGLIGLFSRVIAGTPEKKLYRTGTNKVNSSISSKDPSYSFFCFSMELLSNKANGTNIKLK